MFAALHSELRASEIDAAFLDKGDSNWSKFKKAQAEILGSLQKTAQDVIVKTAEQNAAIEQARSEKFTKMELDLRTQLENERKAMEQSFQEKESLLKAREEAHEAKEAGFVTKEARYHARKLREDQIKEVQDWIKKWELTASTTKKRQWIVGAYILGLFGMGLITGFSTYHSYDLVQTADDLAKLQWWQWVALVSKSIIPLAAFVTLLGYFIRWAFAWAKQHADEEFRNRSRLFDLSRAGWLLEAASDAQDKKSEIPAELLKELSKNLFTGTVGTDGDTHVPTMQEILMKSLTSLKLKVGDTEIEANREKRKPDKRE